MRRIRDLLNAVFSEPFILATGVAAWLHSAWALAMMFSGAIPDIRTQPALWFIASLPAGLLAFSIDVGQVVTANEIRNGQRNSGKVLTFVALAIATYYLQWVYMAAHVPALALGDGVRPEWRMVAELIRDAAIWIIPALLPVATTLYTISNATLPMRPHKRTGAPERKAQPQGRAQPYPEAQPETERIPQLEAQTQRALPAPSGASGGAVTNALADAVAQNADGTYTGYCPHCGYATSAKASARAAKSALAAHGRRCVGVPVRSHNGTH